MAKLVLDLHDIYNKGDQIDRALDQIMRDAMDKKIRLVEIIPGKGSGALKKKSCATSTRSTCVPSTTASKRIATTGAASSSTSGSEIVPQLGIRQVRGAGLMAYARSTSIRIVIT